MDREVLNFRAFFLALGYDLDYTDGINLLAGHGFERLSESGFSESLLKRVGERVSLDDESRRTIASEWDKWQRPALESEGQKTAHEGGDSGSARANRSARTAKVKKEPVYGRCFRCKQKREIRDAQEAILKNGRRAVQGTCPICGSRMNRFI